MPTIIEYKRNNAVRYAEKWAYDRNPQFYDFSNIGGDCTNFISQCLFAGSNIMNYEYPFGWYYININDRSPSWTGVQFLYDFLTNNRKKGVFAVETDITNMQIGDVIQLGNGDEFYHSLIVSSIVSRKTSFESILVSTHSFNAFDRPLLSYDFEAIRFLHIQGVYK